MALEEFQCALERKIDELKHKDALIDDLAEEVTEKDGLIAKLKRELGRCQAIMDRLDVEEDQRKSSKGSSAVTSPDGSRTGMSAGAESSSDSGIIEAVAKTEIDDVK